MRGRFLGLQISWLLLAHGSTACNPPSRNSFSHVDRVLFRYQKGDVVTYKCFTGYKLVRGSKKRTCLSSQTWSGTAPSCVRSFREVNSDCPKPPRSNNANIAFYSKRKTTFHHGDTVRYRCKQGYQLIGPVSLTCNRNKWGSPPVCQKKVICPHRTPSQNTKYVQTQLGITKWYSGAIARFRCDHLFQMSGNGQSRCLRSGRWSSPIPSCSQQQRDPYGCNRPRNPKNGKIRSYPSERNWFSDGHFVRYQCNSGFILSGHPRVTCTGGHWNSAPTCGVAPRLNCTHRPPPSHGRYSRNQAGKKVWFVDDIAYFSCARGYNLLGRKRSRCQKNRKWTTPVPVCINPPRESLSCRLPKSPNRSNGEVIFLLPIKFRFFDGEFIKFKCREGYGVDGDATLKCDNGAWTSEPKCKQLSRCSHQLPPSNGNYVGSQINKTTWYAGEVALFECAQGYTIAGRQKITCRANNLWSDTVPRCTKRATCPHRDPPLNGRYPQNQKEKTVWFAGERARFTCNSGFALIGSSTICSSTGEWINPVPTCKYKAECVKRPAPRNGQIVGKRKIKWTALDVIRFRCNRGFKLLGKSRSTCLATGLWSSDLPVCRASNCRRPKHPQNGRIISSPFAKTSFRLNEFVTYKCYANYHVVGISKVKCINGRWSHKPTCELLGQRKDFLTCRRPTNPINGRLETIPNGKKIFLDREIVRYVCRSGFRVIGDPRATCFEGKWSHEPACVKPLGLRALRKTQPRRLRRPSNSPPKTGTSENQVTCFPRPPPRNGDYSKRQQNKKFWGVGEIASFKCKRGFLLSGNKRSSCHSSGVWSATVPICTRKRTHPPSAPCKRPPNPLKGRIVTIPSAKEVFKDGEFVIYACKNGYTINTRSLATCRNGKWDRQPRCEVKLPTTCLRRPPPPNGRYFKIHQNKTKWRVGDVTGFTCVGEDYQLIGSSVSTCLATGQWSNDIPTCKHFPKNGCKRPLNPSHGAIHSYPTNKMFFSDGDVVQVQCNKGYALPLEVSNVMRCSEKKWTRLPTCKETK